MVEVRSPWTACRSFGEIANSNASSLDNIPEPEFDWLVHELAHAVQAAIEHQPGGDRFRERIQDIYDDARPRWEWDLPGNQPPGILGRVGSILGLVGYVTIQGLSELRHTATQVEVEGADVIGIEIKAPEGVWDLPIIAGCF